MERCVAVLSAVLILQLSFSGVFGAAGDTDDVCKDDGTCTGTTDFCETNADNEKYCKTKEGSNCATTSSCIMNAACTAAGQRCTCEDGYFANTEKTVCVAKVGSNCSAVTTCAPESTCVTSGDFMVCTCKENYIAQRDMMECRKKAGQDCTGGNECTMNAQCTPKTCKCEPGFSEDQYGACGKKSGETCSNDNQCVTYATCKQDADSKLICTCDDSKPANEDNTCGAGAGAIVASFLAIMATFLTPQLL